MADDLSATEFDPVRRQMLRGGVAAAALAGAATVLPRAR
jgi:hypothetical protein